MTNPDYTAVAFLIDRSGSMYRIAEDAAGGIAKFLEDQRKIDGKCTVRIAQFDDQYDVLCVSTPVENVPNPTIDPRGSTALLDAWGKAMTEFGEELAALPEDERPANVIFVVVTDGHENSSHEWTREQVLAKVKEQTEKWNWRFLYLAANQDAVKEGAKYGVARGQTMTYDATGAGAQSAYAAASASITATRTGVGNTSINKEEA
jgi:hypothetical protein